MNKLVSRLLRLNFAFLFASFAFLFASASPALAVTRTSGNLEVTLNDPLFSSTTIWYPGLSETTSIIVKNNGGGTEKIAIEALNESETGNLASVLGFKVTEVGTDRYNSSKTLKNFFDDGIVQLSDLGGGNTTLYDLTITFDEAAGDDYQEREAKFDLKIGFWQEAATPGEEGEISPAVTVTGAGTSVCTATAPSAPTLLSVISAGAGSVALTWTAVSPVTHYLIAYGLTSGTYIYGNPSVGNTTSYTVSGLSGGATYYFVVAGVNDCAPGSFSNELSFGAVLGVSLPGPAEGFIPLAEIGVKGVATEAAVPEVAGIATPSTEPEGEKRVYFWWLVVVIGGVPILLLFYRLARK